MTDDELKSQASEIRAEADDWITQWHYCTEDEAPIVWVAYGCNVDQIPGIRFFTDDSGDWWYGVLPEAVDGER